MPDVEFTGQHAIGSGRKEKTQQSSGAASQTFARWLHHRHAPVELPSAYRLAERHLANKAIVNSRLLPFCATDDEYTC